MFSQNNDGSWHDLTEGDSPKERSHVDRSFLLKLQEEAVSPDSSCHWVRRSTRKPVNLLKDDRRQYLNSCLLEEGRESCLLVFADPIKGRGVKAGRFFKESEFVAEYKGRLIDGPSAEKLEKEYGKNPAIGCFMFFLKYRGTQWCIDATEETESKGRLINHSRRNPNLRVEVVCTDTIHLLFTAACDIQPGTEILYDYGDRSSRSVQSHPWLLK